MLRVVVVEATRGRTVYNPPGEMILDLVRKAQEADESTRNKDSQAPVSSSGKATGRSRGSESSLGEGGELRKD